MSEPPFGFNVPRQPDDDSGAEGGGGGEGQQGAGGLFGDPQQFAEALRQFADLMAYQGGPVNWELAKNAARQTIAAHGDPSVLSNERPAVVGALRLAALGLVDATARPYGVRVARRGRRRCCPGEWRPSRPDGGSISRRSGFPSRSARLPTTACLATFRGSGRGCSALSRITRAGSRWTRRRCAT